MTLRKVDDSQMRPRQPPEQPHCGITKLLQMISHGLSDTAPRPKGILSLPQTGAGCQVQTGAASWRIDKGNASRTRRARRTSQGRIWPAIPERT